MRAVRKRPDKTVPDRTPRAGRPIRSGLTVALVGPDGAGKTSVTAELGRPGRLPRPVKVIYMGVNLEASSLMLPTTRALLAVKRARGRRADLVASPQLDVGDRQATSGSVREGARLGVWLMEEWLRQAVATYHVLRGHIVLFDRHFFADYYHADVDRRQVRRSLPRRLHGWMLRHAYPKPDVTVMLDAPSQRLYERKPEASPEWLEQRRRQYLELADVVPTFFVIDSDRPFDTVVSEVAELIAKVAEDRT